MDTQVMTIIAVCGFIAFVILAGVTAIIFIARLWDK
jgi:hypothetical protein